MRITIAGLIVAAAGSVIFPAASSAQTIEELQAQITALESKVNELKKTAKALASESDLKVKWKGAPELSSRDGNFKMKLRGRLYFDYASVSVQDGAGISIAADKINGTEVRAARLGVEGVLFKNVKYKFEADFSGGDVSVVEALIEYKLKPVSIKVGQFKHMNSLEEQTSSRYITFMERASFTDAFKLSRKVGIAVATGGANWTATAGYFFDDFDSSNANDHNLYAARVTLSPNVGETVKIHLGTSFFNRSENSQSYHHGYSQRPHNHQALKYVKSQKFNITSETFFGLETAAVMGPFSAQAEWGWMKGSLATSELNTNTDPKYNGGYISLSYFLTGESRSYSASKGSFGRLKVKNPVHEGGLGAVQLAVRYDVIDLIHESFGESQDSFLAGVNFHLNNYARIMMNYAHSTVEDSAGVTHNKINSFGLRFQADW